MKPLFFWLVVTSALPTLLGAQSTATFRRVQVGLEATQLRFHTQFGSTPWGGAARIAVRPSLQHPGALLEGTLFYTAESDDNLMTAGLAGGQVGLLLMLPPPRRSGMPSFGLSFGYAAIHYDADKYERTAAACVPIPGCGLGAVNSYRSGWHGSVHVGLSLEAPVGMRAAIRGGGSLIFPIGTSESDNGNRHLRFSVGGAWWL